MAYPPGATYYVELQVYDGFCGDSTTEYASWNAEMDVYRTQARLVCNPPTFIYSPSCDFYAFTTTPDATSYPSGTVVTYDAQGDSFAAGDKKWGKFDNVSAHGPDGDVWSKLAGQLVICSMSAPGFSPPSPPFGPISGVNGYRTVNQAAVARFTINDDWAGWPLATGDEKQSWELLMKLWWGLQKRHAVLGAAIPSISATGVPTVATDYVIYWPPPHVIWSQGLVSSITDNGNNTYDVNVGTVNWDALCEGPDQRWIDYVCRGDCPPNYLPVSYDLVMAGDPYDPFTTVRGTITVETYTPPGPATGVLTISGTVIRDAITAKFIPSLSYLVGKQWYILKAGGPWISDRLPDKPNDNELWKGTVTSGCIDASGNGWLYQQYNDYATDFMYDTSLKKVGWHSNDYAGKEVMVYDAGGVLRRLSVTGNNSNTLYVGTYVPPMSSSSSSGFTCTTNISGIYSIIDAGGKCIPTRVPQAIGRWYGGYTLDNYTHLPDDSIGTAPFVSFDATWQNGDPCSPDPDLQCKDNSHTAKDTDARVEIDNMCEPLTAGDFIAVDYYKAVRALQLDVLSICTSFVPPDDFSGKGFIPLYTSATLLNDCGINSWTSTLTYSGGHWSVTPPSFAVNQWPLSAYYAVPQGDDSGTDTTISGQTTVAADGTLSASFTHPDDEGKTIILSAGFTRYRPREVRQMFYKKACFLPDTDPLSGGAIYPPSVTFDPDTHETDCNGKGIWLRRGLSTNYLSNDDNGFTGDGDVAFVENELARYVGDNWHDPAFGGFDGHGPDAQPLDPFKDAFYRGHLNKSNTDARKATMVGLTTDGTKYYIENSLTDFWNIWPTTGVSRTEASTASGGSTTTLSDSSKDTTDDTKEWICWWSAERWFTGDPFVGMILEITKAASSSSSSGLSSSSSGTASRSVYYVPITATSNGAGGVTFHFDAVDGLTVATGDTYKVREPMGEWDTFADREVKLTNETTGDSYTVTITHNDDKRLYFAPQTFTVGVGWKYEIIEKQYGTVWKWNGSSWDLAAGSDSTRLAVATPEDFRRNATLNLPTVVKDYGFLRKDDYFAKQTLNELYAAINKLYCTYLSASWNLATYWISSGGTVTIDGSTLQRNYYDPPGADDYCDQYQWTITDDGSGHAVWPMTTGVSYDGNQQVGEGGLRITSGSAGTPVSIGYGTPPGGYDPYLGTYTYDPISFGAYIYTIFEDTITLPSSYTFNIGGWSVTDINGRGAAGSVASAGGPECQFTYPAFYATTLTCLNNVMCDWKYFDCALLFAELVTNG